MDLMAVIADADALTLIQYRSFSFCNFVDGDVHPGTAFKYVALAGAIDAASLVEFELVSRQKPCYEQLG